MKRFVIPLLASVMFAGIAPNVAVAQTVRTEAMSHPRIAAAIRQMEDAIRYMESAPHDFGGHKESAIRDTRAAIAELRMALAYRARMDR
jgi:hypothetical protein